MAGVKADRERRYPNAGSRIQWLSAFDWASDCITESVVEVKAAKKGGAMWNRRDWDDFFDIVGKRWHMRRPPRPVDRSRPNRLVPTEGYSLAELDDAGLSIEQAERLGLPVDAGRVGSYGPNVSALRDYLRATRSRL
jgi:ribosomal protein L13E